MRALATEFSVFNQEEVFTYKCVAQSPMSTKSKVNNVGFQ